MSRIITRLLPLFLLCLLHPDGAGAQQGDRTPSLKLGDAVVTGFSGTAPDPTKRRSRNQSPADITFINPDGPSVRVIDVSRPGYVWDGRLFAAPKKFDVLAKDVGQVFGVALDDAAQPNIYVAATSVFGLNIVSRGRDGVPERRKKGGPGAGWMKGQFGLDLQGGPGAIYKIDGRTGVPTLFANVTLDGVPNPGPGLGNLAYDSAHKQLFVSDLYSGMIHRFDLDGKELGSYDHGVTGLGAAKLATVAFNPKSRPNIASDRFDSEKPDSWGFAPAARRVWGLAVHEGRLYYSVVSGPQIWSVGIERDGSFAADPRWELDVPAQAGPLPVSDIAFSQKGAMILAQRALIAGAYDYSAFTRPGEPQVFRVWLKGPKDPPSPGRWKLVPEEYAVGFAGNFRNTNGGVALGYGYGKDGALSANACEFSLWTTAQNVRNAPALKDRLDPGGPLVVHGLAGVPASPVREINTPPWLSYAVDFADGFRDPRAAGHLGSVRIYAKPCSAPAVYSGPGYVTNPPYIVGTVVTPPADCIFGSNCPPSPPVIDLGVGKIGEYNPNNTNGPYNFTIGVRNLGIALSGPQTITVTDVVPAGMTFTSVTSTNWTCAPLPVIPAGGTVTCTYTGSFPVASNQLLGTIDIVATGSGGPYVNCADLGQPDGDMSNNEACVTVQPPPLDVKLDKKLKDQAGPHAIFEIDVSNVGVPFANGAFTVTDTVPAGMTVISTGGPWTCVTLPVTGPGTMTCTLPVASIPFNFALPPINFTAMTSGIGPWQNCATVSVVTADGVDTNSSNDSSCATVTQLGELIVVKKVVSHLQGTILPPQTFPVNVTCGSTPPTTLNLVPNVPQSIGGIPYGTRCSVLEPPPAVPNICPQGSTGAWTISYAPSPPSQIAINSVSTTVTVTNTFDCKQGGSGDQVTVKKEVVNGEPLSLSTTGLTYTANVICTLGSSPAVTYPVTLTDGGSQTVSNIASGSSCTVTEVTPLPTPIGSCTTPGDVPTWTIDYLPPTAVNSGNPGPTVVIRNTLNCKPAGSPLGTLVLTKVVQNNTGGQVSTTGLTYPTAVTCRSGGSPAVLTNVDLSESGPQTVTNIALGSSCEIVETPPTLTGNCAMQGDVPTWSTVMNPSSPVPVDGTTVTVTVTNTLACQPGGQGDPTGYLLVGKSIINQTNDHSTAYLTAYNALVFPVTATCGGNDTPMTLGVTAGQAIVHAVPVGQLCSVAEGTLPPPPPTSTGCTGGLVPTWGPVTFNPPSGQVIMTGPPSPAIGVVNTLICAPPPPQSPPRLQCSPPQIPNPSGTGCICPAGMTLIPGQGCVTQTPTYCVPPMMQGPVPGQCVCGQGYTLVGGACVKQTSCKPPMVPGPVGGACVCPQGTVQSGNDCVKQTSCKPPMVPGPVGGACVCPAGRVKKGSQCVEPVVCRSPAKLNSAGTACTCPEGMTKKGNTCVEKQKQGPRITPNDVINGIGIIRGLGGGGGRGGGGGGGAGGGGGPSKGGGGSPGKP